jgi:hypothetical protein
MDQQENVRNMRFTCLHMQAVSVILCNLFRRFLHQCCLIASSLNVLNCTQAAVGDVATALRADG